MMRWSVLLLGLLLALSLASTSPQRKARCHQPRSTPASTQLRIQTAAVQPAHAGHGPKPLLSRGLGSLGWAMYMDRTPEFALALQEGDVTRAARAVMWMYVRRLGKIVLCVHLSRLGGEGDADPRVFLAFLLLDSAVNLHHLVGDEYWMAARLAVHRLFVVLWRLEGLPFFLCFALFPELFAQMWTWVLLLDIFWSLSYENSVGKLIQ